MGFLQRFEVERQLLPVPSNRRGGRLISPGVNFIVAHDTGNPGSSAQQNVHYYASTPGVGASAHVFVDDRQIIECIPALCGAPEKAWHVLVGAGEDNARNGHDANDVAIGVEYCYGTAIDADAAYHRYVWVMAYLCHLHGLDPASAVIGHFMLDPHRKTDPVTGLAHSRRSYDRLLVDVAGEYRACGGAPWVAPERPGCGEVVTLCALHIRQGGPHRFAPVLRTAPGGARLRYVEVVPDGEPINGNSVWFADPDGNYFWSGATEPGEQATA